MLPHRVELTLPAEHAEHSEINRLRAMGVTVELQPAEGVVVVVASWRGPSAETDSALAELAKLRVGPVRVMTKPAGGKSRGE